MGGGGITLYKARHCDSLSASLQRRGLMLQYIVKLTESNVKIPLSSILKCAFTPADAPSLLSSRASITPSR